VTYGGKRSSVVTTIIIDKAPELSTDSTSSSTSSTTSSVSIVKLEERLASPQNKIRKCSINLDKLATWLVAPKCKNRSDSDLKEVKIGLG